MFQTRWKFDIQIDEPDEQYYSISELIRMGDDALAAGEFDNAFRYYSRAESSSAGKHRLAKICIQVPGVNRMTQGRRFETAEKVLLEIQPISKEVCMDLADLYLNKLHREVAALCYLLRAQIMGAKIDPVTIGRCRKNITKSGISAMEGFPQDCYDLACALRDCGLGEGRYSEYLLQIAIDAREKCSASAALLLAELFDAEADDISAKKYYCLASELGNPPVLKRKKLKT